MQNGNRLHLIFEDGAKESGPGVCIAPGRYRLGWTPFVAWFDDVEVHRGDVIEVEATADGRHRFLRVVERGSNEHSGFVVGPAFLKSSHFAAFVAALQAAGGSWEVPINGWLLIHLPPESSFDVAGALAREQERAYHAGFVDPLGGSE